MVNKSLEAYLKGKLDEQKRISSLMNEQRGCSHLDTKAKLALEIDIGIRLYETRYSQQFKPYTEEN